MHITLISADDEVWASGLRSISATLRQAGHETTMVFAGTSQVPVDESVVAQIAALAADSGLIGVSSMCRGSERAAMLIDGLRSTDKLIVWGGMHPILHPERCANHADLVCLGEGEEFMLDLVDRVASRRGFEDIRGGAYMSSGVLVSNELRPLIADLDRLPLPDFAFEDEYVLDATGALKPNSEMRMEEGVLFSGSRGCTNSCAYCSNSRLKSIYQGTGRWARKMSVPRFVYVAKEYRQLFPSARLFYFTDEDFFARTEEEMKELADAYSREVGLPFECMVSPRQVTDRKVALAADAGLWRIDVGLESGSERVRREIFNRHVDDDTQLRAARAIDAHARGRALYFLIVGNPYETRKDLLDGVRFLRRLPLPFFLRTYSLVFIPGTRLFERACMDRVIEGMGDSAFDMDFLAGFDHRQHSWKKANLYLNGLLSLMQGKHTRFRAGLVPRALLPGLSADRVVDFCDHHPRIGELLGAFARLSLRARVAAAARLGKVDRDAPRLPARSSASGHHPPFGRRSTGAVDAAGGAESEVH